MSVGKFYRCVVEFKMKIVCGLMHGGQKQGGRSGEWAMAAQFTPPSTIQSLNRARRGTKIYWHVIEIKIKAEFKDGGGPIKGARSRPTSRGRPPILA